METVFVTHTVWELKGNQRHEIRVFTKKEKAEWFAKQAESCDRKTNISEVMPDAIDWCYVFLK